MAITINSSPIGGQYITMAHNPVEFVVTSSNKTQTNFRYIADLYWNGATQPIRFQMGVDPTYGSCRFDFSSVVRNLVTYNPPIVRVNDFYDCPDSYQTITVKFGEQYGASSALTNYVNLTTFSMKVWNASLPIDRWWNAGNPTSDYVVGEYRKKFLTDVPNSQSNPYKICTTDYHYLYFLQDGQNDPVHHVTLETYRADGTLIQSVTWEDTFTQASAVQRIGVGYANLLNCGGEQNFSGTLPVVSSSVDTYSVQLFNSDEEPTALTKKFWFKVECECTWETPYRLCFLNKLGGYDFFNFNWNSKKTSTYEKSNFQSKIWDFNSTGTGINYNSYRRGKTTYSTIGSDKLQLTSGWITEEQSTWLEELISSPDVYIIDAQGFLTAVTVTDTQYDYKTLEYDELFNLTVNLEFAYSRYRQAL